MKTYGKMKVQLNPFLTLALDGSERSASRPGRFTPGEGGGCVVPRAGQDAVGRQKFPASAGNGTPVVQPVV
jgi:hypothetical protein